MLLFYCQFNQIFKHSGEGCALSMMHFDYLEYLQSVESINIHGIVWYFFLIKFTEELSEIPVNYLLTHKIHRNVYSTKAVVFCITDQADFSDCSSVQN